MFIIYLAILIFCFLYLLGLKFYCKKLINDMGFIWGSIVILSIICLLLPGTLGNVIRLTGLILIIIMIPTFIYVMRKSLFLENIEEIIPEYIVVHGCNIDKEGKPCQTLLDRLDIAFYTANRFPNSTVIVSGGQGKDEPENESTAMKKYLMSRGLPDKRIIEENKAESTWENLLYSMKIMQNDDVKVALVSSRYHIPRCLYLAQKLGYKNVYGISSGKKGFLYLHYIIREYLTMIVIFILGK